MIPVAFGARFKRPGHGSKQAMGARLTRNSLLLLLVGCEDSVLLGTECATGEMCGRNEPEETLEGSGFTSTPARAPSPNGGRLGVSPAETLAAGGSVVTGYSTLSLRNPSFEASAGQSGSFALINISPSAALSVAPWQPCQLLNVGLSDVLPGFLNFAAFAVQQSLALGTTEAPNLVLPTDGDDFVTVSFPSILPTSVAVPLSQPLEQPLVAGARYAFSVNLRQLDPAPDNTYTLQVYASNQSCAPNGSSLEASAPLASVAVPNTGKWESVCVSFNGQGSASDFMLVAGTNATASISGLPGFAMDNIRVSDGACTYH